MILGYRVCNNFWIGMYMFVFVLFFWYIICLEISGRRKLVKVGKLVLGCLDLCFESCVIIYNLVVYFLDFFF